MTTSRLLIVGLLWATLAPPLQADTSAGLTLATELAADGNHAGAALEYRRLAMDTSDPKSKGAIYWMAAYDYMKAQRFAQAERMLSQSENTTPELETEVYLLRGEHSRVRNRLREAAFYLESIAHPEQDAALRTVAAKKLAAVRLQMRDFEGAREVLTLAEPTDLNANMEAIRTYEAGKDKNHVVGGLLGLIPGVGYAYSGEYANAARSLLLNALCIWGLVEFVEEEQWGGVALVGFAEATFYSGSIYGGADAAVRYNQRRLDQAIEAIEGDARFTPDRATLPVLTLKYRF
ncbi:MAG: hypothetical protein QGH42_04715 [Kiritimatiellia bacterium]|jgi:hypothetical protein|nr:hypothetical protein [Kiritimatiellia bacterium]MDP6631281.1 hypothetical protein [Kiritimatiellia bacterium]MDP6809612.1 hypothetical protein [Kiritimatiellia bacterium]MDP7023537.1 hypothetical protein [Kiritimatiellia bacterium]